MVAGLLVGAGRTVRLGRVVDLFAVGVVCSMGFGMVGAVRVGGSFALRRRFVAPVLELELGPGPGLVPELELELARLERAAC